MPSDRPPKTIDPDQLRDSYKDVLKRIKRSADNKETWVDWLEGEPEPEQLYTRDEIVARANSLIDRFGNKVVKAGDLQLWEKIGVLPRPVRRRHGDAQYALYPEWFAYLVRQVRQLQREGYSLDEIRPRIRAYARMTLGYGRTNIDEEIGRNVQSPEQITLRPLLVDELEQLARWWSHLRGAEVDRIEVHVIPKEIDRVQATKYPLPIASHDESGET